MKIRHVFSHFQPPGKQDSDRLNLAAFTWRSQGWEECPVSDGDLPCLFTESRNKNLPFVRDIIDHGCKDLLYDDIIIYTNSDTFVSTDCLKKVKKALKVVDACYSYRRDFPYLLDVVPDDKIKDGKDYVGSDLHAFKMSWWKENRKKYPKLVLARDAVDAILRTLIDETCEWPKTKLANIIYHSEHEKEWDAPEKKYSLPGNLLNQQLARGFLKARNIRPSKFSIPDGN